LVGDEIDPERAGLLVDPFMERAAHAAAPVVEYLDAFELFRCFHGGFLSRFSVNTENNERARGKWGKRSLHIRSGLVLVVEAAG
jgi:hypothetical protein